MRWLMAVVSVLVVARLAGADGFGGMRDSTSLTRHLQIRQAEAHPDWLGLEFDLRYSRLRDPADAIRNYGLEVMARGFQSFQRHIPDVNHMAAEVGLKGLRYVTGMEKLDAAERERHRALSHLEQEGLGLTPAQEAEMVRLNAKLFAPGRLWTYDLHYRFETDHDVTLEQHAFGAGGGTELPLLHRLLDLIPRVTCAPTADRPLPVRAYVAAEYLTADDDASLGGLGGEARRLWRLRATAVWKTRVLSGFDLRAEWLGEYFPDAPRSVRESRREFNSFVRVWLIVPLSPGSQHGIVVRYLDGRLPPTYESVTSAKIGLLISLARGG